MYRPLEGGEKMVDYLIVGYGSLGSKICQSLKKKGERILVLESYNENYNKAIEDGMEARLADARDPTLLRRVGGDKVKVVIITPSDPNVIRDVIESVRKVNSEATIIARAKNPSIEKELGNLGCDVVISASETLSEAMLREVEKIYSSRNARRLERIIMNVASVNGRFAIVMHDAPDPDSIASAMAFREILKNYDIESDIIYGGEISHQENRALINLVDVDLVNVSELDAGWARRYKAFAMIDCNPEYNNVSAMPNGKRPNVVIDHHQVDVERVRELVGNDGLVDIREVGATSTILVEYLERFKVEVSPTLATALLYGIRSDTSDYTRDATREDFIAVSKLLPRVDLDLLSKIETPPISSETLDVLGEAIRNRRVIGSILISNVGYIEDRDSLVQAADYLLRLEGISTVLVFGILGDEIHMSARSNDVRVNIGKVMERAFRELGSAGGHPKAAGAKVPLGLFKAVKDKETLVRLVGDAVTKKFLEALGKPAEVLEERSTEEKKYS